MQPAFQRQILSSGLKEMAAENKRAICCVFATTIVTQNKTKKETTEMSGKQREHQFSQLDSNFRGYIILPKTRQSFVSVKPQDVSP